MVCQNAGNSLDVGTLRGASAQKTENQSVLRTLSLPQISFRLFAPQASY